MTEPERNAVKSLPMVKNSRTDYFARKNVSSDIENFTLTKYMPLYYVLCEKIEIYDSKIEEYSRMHRFKEAFKKLCCFKGIKTYTAMAIISELSNFTMFQQAGSFAAYLGLVPREWSSYDK